MVWVFFFDWCRVGCLSGDRCARFGGLGPHVAAALLQNFVVALFTICVWCVSTQGRTTATLHREDMFARTTTHPETIKVSQINVTLTFDVQPLKDFKLNFKAFCAMN